ncbi:hypothetical protein D9758_007242 [Tetrapyrgos nigripes]|uniref:Uncharacterized protein n=1 Tax=Tetrapyrgos nigripes TaxID=182062 RepID=A0A8H5D126_9AGAR|nr:hypothetical protein D9758_007242 [Tetrapyrgos nigripes]
MSLDQNLFTLILAPNKDDPTNVVDLAEPSGVVHYRKQRMEGPVYKAEVYDFTSQSLLAIATAPSATSKTKMLELYNPTKNIELKYTGKLSFKWSFKWEEHEFEWKREECYLIRKPDPPVLVAITKEPAGRLKTQSVQILDYNLNRFDVEDRKGLEIVILTALLTFQDANEASHEKRQNSSSSLAALPKLSPTPSTSPPPLPSKPQPKTGIDRIAEMHAIRGDINEVTVEEEGSANDYAAYCWNLLQDDAMLFVTIRSNTETEVLKVLQVVEETKRLRHKAGLDDDFHQYVLYDTKKSGPRRINLDQPQDGYTPPNSLQIHLSKIPMPELEPRPSLHHGKENSDTRKDGKTEKKVSPSSSPGPGHLSLTSLFGRRSSSPPSATSLASTHVHAHQVHPHQPSPSPAQLNNPMIYVAPPPPRHTKPKPKQPNSPGHGLSPGAGALNASSSSPAEQDRPSRLSEFFDKLHH